MVEASIAPPILILELYGSEWPASRPRARNIHFVGDWVVTQLFLTTPPVKPELEPRFVISQTL